MISRNFELSDFFSKICLENENILRIFVSEKIRLVHNVTDLTGGMENAKNPTSI